MKLKMAATLAAIVALAVSGSGQATKAAAGTGTIKGHVRLMGKLPGNPFVRMGVDPMCAKINAGKRIVNEIVPATIDGSLANVFVSVQGTFPDTPVPATPVTIDQKGCMYAPRVVGVRVGQMLALKNSDALLHNVHGLSAGPNSFNVAEPLAGMVQQFKMKSEEIMVHVKCDVHSWMTAYVGVVKHPYFAVTDTGGTFQIGNVPAGTYKIQAWQERFGIVTQMVTVKPGGVATVDFSYTGNETAPVAGIRDLTIEEGLLASR